MNSVCNRFKKIALEIRVFGYKGSSILELDSFLNFISQARLRVSPLISRDTSVWLLTLINIGVRFFSQLYKSGQTYECLVIKAHHYWS